eukprot:6124162-Prorocentrum_lima.AAC.1
MVADVLAQHRQRQLQPTKAPEHTTRLLDDERHLTGTIPARPQLNHGNESASEELSQEFTN